MKLIDLLVKELPRRGGWPEGALNATQDEDGEVNFSEGATPVFGSVAWHDGDWCGNEFYTIRADDYDTAIITRDQYESAIAASDDWIEWNGGKCPVDSDAIVKVKFRWHNQHQYNNDRAGDFDWAHTGRSSDIIAYRLHNPEIKSRANDDRLEQDLNECIGQGAAVEWNGEGLPPIGTICEAKVPRSITGWEWREVKVVESGIHGAEKEVLVYDLETTFPSWTDEFRPLRTEAERKREAAAKEMARHANSDQHRKFNAGLRNCLSIYDAIAAGKIPGVKLEGK